MRTKYDIVSTRDLINPKSRLLCVLRVVLTLLTLEI